MSGVNGKVIMSGCGDDNPDDERREAARSNTESVSRRADGGGGRDGDRSQRGIGHFKLSVGLNTNSRPQATKELISNIKPSPGSGRPPDYTTARQTDLPKVLR